MKRQLNKQERELTEKGCKRLAIEIQEIEDNLEYNRALIDKQKYLRNFDDLHRDYLRNLKDKEDKQLLKQMENIINQKRNTLNNMEKQLKEGVENKKPTGVG